MAVSENGTLVCRLAPPLRLRVKTGTCCAGLVMSPPDTDPSVASCAKQQQHVNICLMVCHLVSSLSLSPPPASSALACVGDTCSVASSNDLEQLAGCGSCWRPCVSACLLSQHLEDRLSHGSGAGLTLIGVNAPASGANPRGRQGLAPRKTQRG